MMEAYSGWPLAQEISPIWQLFLESIHLLCHLWFLLLFFSLKYRAVFCFQCCVDYKSTPCVAYHLNLWTHHSKISKGSMPEVVSFPVLLDPYHNQYIIETENQEWLEEYCTIGRAKGVVYSLLKSFVLVTSPHRAEGAEFHFLLSRQEWNN